MPKITGKTTSNLSNSSNQSGNLQSLEELDRKKFCVDFGEFTTQAVTGAIMAYISGLGIPKEDTCIHRVESVLTYFSKVYLNSCWHSYSKRNDEFVVASLDKIMSYQIIKGNVCLIHCIDRICSAVLSFDVVHELFQQVKHNDDDEKRIYISAMVAKIIATLMEANINSFKCVSEENCSNEYDGTDFFGFEVVGMDSSDEDEDNDDNDNEFDDYDCHDDDCECDDCLDDDDCDCDYCNDDEDIRSIERNDDYDDGDVYDEDDEI